MPRETLDDTPAPTPKPAAPRNPRGGGGAPKKQGAAPPPPPPPPPAMDVPEEERSQTPMLRDRMAAAEQRAWDRALTEGLTTVGGVLVEAAPTVFAPALMAASAMSGQDDDRSAMIGKAINRAANTVATLQAPQVEAGASLLPPLARKKVQDAMRYLLSERPGYDVQQALPSMLNMGAPKTAMVANLSGSPTVVYPEPEERPTSEQLSDPVAFRAKVEGLRQRLREVEQQRDAAKTRYETARRGEASDRELRPMSQDFDAALRRVAGLRQSLREFGYKDEEIDEMR